MVQIVELKLWPLGESDWIDAKQIRDLYKQMLQIPCAGCGEHQLMEEQMLMVRPYRIFLCERCAFANLELVGTCADGHDFMVRGDRVWECKTLGELNRLFHCPCNRGTRRVRARRAAP